MASEDSPLSFPCRFPIKVMGENEPSFQSLVLGVIESHAGTIPSADVSARASRNGRYVSVTVTLMAESRAQLDDIYRTLTANARVLFVL